MLTTANYSLRIWETTDNFNQGDLQFNWETIDTKLAEARAAKNAQLLGTLPGSPINGEMVYLTAANGGFDAGTTVVYITAESGWRSLHTERRNTVPGATLYDGRTVYLTADNGGFLIGDTIRYHTSSPAGWRRVGNVGKAAGESLSATSISALNTAAGGTPYTGQTGLLRLSSTPYDFVPLTFDSTYNKWVSAPVCLYNGVTSPSTTSTTYVYLNSADQGLGTALPFFDVKIEAGLFVQFNLSARLKTAATDTASLALWLADAADGSTAHTDLATQFCEITNNTSTYTFKTSGWVQPTVSASSNAHAIVNPKMKTSAGTANFQTISIWMRWAG